MDQFSFLPTVPPPSPPFPSSSSSSLFISPPQPAEDHGHDEWTFEENQALEEALSEFDFVSPAPPFPSSSSSTLCISQPQLAEGNSSDQWTFEENKRFEDALAEFDLGAPDLFVNIQTRVPGKTLWQIKKHLDDLYEDIDNIEKGVIPIPDYKTTPTQVKSNPKSKTTRKKGVTWTEEEHKLFLEGLQKYGKGDWKSISRHCVVSRNPTQVASHAQKYFLRLQNSAGYDQQGGGRDESASLQNHAQVPERRKYKKRSKA